jgi:uncharacterized protein (TIRG00374 family)
MLLKALISAGFLLFVLLRLDYQQALELITQQSLFHFIPLLVGIAFSWIFMTFRWSLILSFNTIKIPMENLLKAIVIGHTFNQFLPSSVGGDFYRLLLLRQWKVAAPVGLGGLILDRLLGLFALGVILVIVPIFYQEQALLSHLMSPLASSLVFLFLGICALIFLKLLPNKWFERGILQKFLSFKILIHTLLSHPTYLLSTILLSCLGHFCLILGIHYLALSFSMPLNYYDSFFIFPLLMIITSIPISFAGWGIREGGMISLLGIYGIPKESALALSMLIGFIQILAGAPGFILWIFTKKPKETDPLPS